MKEKLILILLDGLNNETARKGLGNLEGLVREKVFSTYTVDSFLPAMSRPLYESLHTGRSPFDHGIFNNGVVRRSQCENIFSKVKKERGTTGAAAYYWMAELYSKAPFHKMTDRFLNKGTGAIDYGIFYWEDSYPDSHLLADAHYIIEKHQPNYVLVHTMNIDDAGHHYGSDSPEYYQACVKVDVALSNYLKDWMEQGYSILVASDHGMGIHKAHNGSCDKESQLPLYIYEKNRKFEDLRNQPIPQSKVTEMACEILGIQLEKES